MAGGRAATESVIPGRCAISVGDPKTDLPPGWKWVLLSEIAELGTGHTPSRDHPEYWDGDVPWIGIRDARAHHSGVIVETSQTITELGLAHSAARLLPKDTVCLSRTASVGYVVKMGRLMATSQDFVTWSCSGAIDPDFLMKALLAEGDDIRNFGEGSTHTTIYFPEVKAFHISLPPVPEQQRIVAKLDSLFARSKAARTELRRIPALVRRAKDALLRSTFDDLVCQRGRVSDIVTSIEAGKNIRCIERPPEASEIGLVKVSAVTWGKFDAHASKTMPLGFNPPPHTLIKSGDFLFSRANTIELVGACVIVEDAPENLYLSDKILRLNVAAENKHWLMWFLRSPSGRSALEAVSSGNQLSMRNISQAGLMNIEMPLPPLDVRHQGANHIVTTFSKLDALAVEARSAIALLDRLDQSVLARAFRGELVPQDPNDEPASVLLDRIRAERAARPATRTRRRRVGQAEVAASG